MSIFGLIITFTIVWWTVFFAALPFGVRGHSEAGEALPRGADVGSPTNPDLKRKALVTTAIAIALTAAMWALVTFHVLDWLIRS